MIPDWQLPPGTDRGVWDYTHNPELAKHYDQSLAGTPLLELDLAYCDEQFPAPGKLIDLGCGTGRLALRFAAKGFQCTAVDLSTAMLHELKFKAAKQNLPIETIEANLVQLDELPDITFDYAACLFSTLGMIRGADNRTLFLKHVYRILKPGGRFVLHAHNRWHYLFRLTGGLWVVRDMLRTWRQQEPGEYPMPQHFGGAKLTLRHFGGDELQTALREEGFTIDDFRPISIRRDGRFRIPFLKQARAYGFLLSVRKPEN